MLMFESHRLTNRFPIYRIMPELQGNLKNDDRTPIRFKREVYCVVAGERIKLFVSW